MTSVILRVSHIGVVRPSGVHLWGRDQKSLITPALEDLYIEGNIFHSSLVFADLPDDIIGVNVADNKFPGIADMSGLPKFIDNITISKNMFEEVVNIPESYVVDGHRLTF